MTGAHGEASQRLFDGLCRKDFRTFLGKAVGLLSPGQTFIDNWHIGAIVSALERVRRGECKRLIINLPPRSLKSIIGSVAFPAYLLGKDPTARIICASYGADLAKKHANDHRALMESTWYRRVFPGTIIDPRKNTEGEFATTARGLRLSVSVGGPLTGRGGNFIIIDDPLKPQDALSAVSREAVNEWFLNTLLSRLDDKRTGAIIIIMQRVHMDDLVGFVRGLGDEWEVLSFPAICEQDEMIQLGDGTTYHRKAGEALHAAREPIEVLERLRHQLGFDTFMSQYQQQPVPPGGAMIKRAWIARFDRTRAISGAQIIQSWDTANKGGAANDWCVCTTWAVKSGHYYLIDVYRARHDYPELKAKAFELAERYKATRILIEDAGTGTALIQEMRQRGKPAIAVLPEKDKVTRMSVQSSKFESGLVHLPTEAPWLAVLEAELFAFPGAKHDDQVDSISQLLANSSYGYILTDEMLA